MRRGVVLFITLGILLMLSTVIFLFLRQTGELKKSVRQNVALIQTNLILSDLSGFLKNQNFTQDDIFYGAGIPVSLDLGPVSGMLTIDSARNRLDINTVLRSVMKEQNALDSFMLWMEYRRIKHPQFLLALLLDTLDTDLYERERGSEIRLNYPWFQNGAIPDTQAMERILQTYRTYTGDTALDLAAWEAVFGYEGNTFDLNYANTDQLLLLFPDFPPDTLAKLAAHNNRYEAADDLPIAEEYKVEVLQPHLGISPILFTDAITVSIDFNTTQECSGSMAFRMGLKKKKITHLQLSAIQCP
ncbi:hypothetical protein [Hydrogenimonas sp.]